MYYIWWLLPTCIVSVFLISMVAVWIYVSFHTFPHTLHPGQSYIVDGRNYHVPHLPHKEYGSKNQPTLDTPIPMLKHQMLIDLRTLILTAFDMLQRAHVTFWVTGGTLISAALWHQLMPYDDDVDIAVNWIDREYVWSPEFGSMADQAGLETFFLRCASLQSATREGSVVRLRRKGTIVPTMDIFFVREKEDGTYAKVNTWSSQGSLTYEPRETWHKEWLYPLQTLPVDGMTWPVAHAYPEMLTLQYGPHWSTLIQSPNPLTKSHAWAFWISNQAGAWITGPKSTRTDPLQWVNPRPENAYAKETGIHA